ncbi:MAG: Spy/CpxP family protein refolding chaperone [Acidobacteriota bacterium]|nr:Spy/CpxP family protein refolding chaperone [Acidobacteriota bacterium]
MKTLSKLKTLTIASLSAVALAAPIAFAQSTGSTQDNQQVNRGEHRGAHNKDGKGWGRKGRGGHFGRGSKGMRGGMFRGIELTEDQKARMKQINDSFRQRTQALQQELRSKRQELRQATEGGTFNEALASQKLTETAGLQARLMGERFKMRQEMQSLLTAEQKTQIEQKRAEFKAKRGERGKRNVQ